MDITLLEAARLLRAGKVVAVPTETVYGLAASLFEAQAIHEIFRLKNRPANNPLIIHTATVEDILPFTYALNKEFEALSRTFWPGPLTLVLPIRSEMIPEVVRGNLLTAAFRIPAHPLAKELLGISGPLVMPSANLSGRPSSTLKKHVEADFGENFPVLDGGQCAAGLESTILYCDEGIYKIIRQGAIPGEDFVKVLSYKPEIAMIKKGENPLCPGQLYRHYAPKAKLILVKTIPKDFKGVVVGFEERHYPEGVRVYILGSLKNPFSISKKLYEILRQLDDENVLEAYVDIDMPEQGFFSALLERLQKAAS